MKRHLKQFIETNIMRYKSNAKTYTQAVAFKEIKDYINQLEADKMELSKAVVEVFKIQRKNYGHSMDLHLDMITFAEDIKPLVLKAEKYIKENK